METFESLNIIGSSAQDAYRRFARYRSWKDPSAKMGFDLIREFVREFTGDGSPPLYVVAEALPGKPSIPESVEVNADGSRWSAFLAQLLVHRSRVLLTKPHVGPLYRTSFATQVAYVSHILGCLPDHSSFVWTSLSAQQIDTLLHGASLDVWQNPMLRPYKRTMQDAFLEDYDPTHLLWHLETLGMVDMLFMCLLGRTSLETLEVIARMEEEKYDTLVLQAHDDMEYPEKASDVAGVVPGIRALFANSILRLLSSVSKSPTSSAPSSSNRCVIA